MFYSRASEALFLFIRLSLTGSVAFCTYPSKPAARGIIKTCGIIKRFSSLYISLRFFESARVYHIYRTNTNFFVNNTNNGAGNESSSIKTVRIFLLRENNL